MSDESFYLMVAIIMFITVGSIIYINSTPRVFQFKPLDQNCFLCNTIDNNGSAPIVVSRVVTPVNDWCSLNVVWQEQVKDKNLLFASLTCGLEEIVFTINTHEVKKE